MTEKKTDKRNFDEPHPAKIVLLYESRDKKLCLFQDANGHLTAVRSARLA